MIYTISGTIAKHTKQGVVLVAHGFGIELLVSNVSLFQIGNFCEIFVYMHWNQEQGPSLYGFNSDFEKSVFILAISCSGIGPKVGLAILQDLGAHSFIQAIQANDVRALSKVSGIGGKKAEHIIVQLKHKIDQLVIDWGVVSDPDHEKWQTVVQALEALHYSRGEINVALQKLKNNAHPATSVSFDQLLRSALSFLSK